MLFKNLGLDITIFEVIYFCSIVVVCRIGGSTSDATLIEVNSGMYRVIASKIDHALGGDVFDETLVKVFKQEFKR